MSDSNQAGGQGEFRGNVTRDTFEPAKHFTRVLMQQGRVQLDADWNEQTSILLYYLRSLAADLIGPHGGPDEGFKIESATVGKDSLTFKATAGRYYVDGILCETDEIVFTTQPSFLPLTANMPYLVFLDVWERHITCHEDGDICEVALGTLDTATRAQVVCQVIVPPPMFPDKTELYDQAALKTDVGNRNAANGPTAIQKAQRVLDGFADDVRKKLVALGNASLRARARVGEVADAPCAMSPASQYRGAENQLYRVEIQRGGSAWGGARDQETRQAAGNASQAATFKWSRDNGSVFFPVRTIAGDSVKLATFGPDGRRSLKKDDWVEIVDDDLALQGRAGLLRQIQDIKPDEMTVILSASVPQTYDEKSTTHPLLRRWDQSRSDGDPADNALLLTESSGEDVSNWITLEDGVQIQFPPPSGGATYRAGDYWLIPARVATGDVLWPKQKTSTGAVDTYPSGNPIPAPLPPHGVEHHYAPLAVISLDGTGNITEPPTDLRRKFGPAAQ